MNTLDTKETIFNFINDEILKYLKKIFWRRNV